MTRPDDPTPARVGVWIAGVCGDIAATVIAGARAMAHGLAGSTGLTTALPAFAGLDLVDPAALCFGGAELGDAALADAVRALHRRSRTLDRDRLDAIGADIDAIAADIVRLPDLGWDPDAPRRDPAAPLRESIDAVRAALRAFRARHHLDRVIVVNLISAGPEPAPSPDRDSLAGLDGLIDGDRRDLLSPSLAYAYAAIAEGCPYVNFTPNPGTGSGGLLELARRAGVPVCGDDGKTGETLVKTALAPMFAMRNLRVLAWEGVNLLGNADGRALAEPRNRTAKLRHKEGVLAEILGYAPHAGVDINYVPTLGDWKTAWDLIQFQGFLDVPMTMQFTWQGCDSILAAPLVLDLVRLADLAARRGEAGPMTHTAVFFKRPLGVTEMALHRQFQMLLEHLAGADAGG